MAGVLDGIVNPVVISPEETVYKDAVDAYKNTILDRIIITLINFELKLIFKFYFMD